MQTFHKYTRILNSLRIKSSRPVALSEAYIHTHVHTHTHTRPCPYDQQNLQAPFSGDVALQRTESRRFAEGFTLIRALNWNARIQVGSWPPGDERRWRKGENWIIPAVLCPHRQQHQASSQHGAHSTSLPTCVDHASLPAGFQVHWLPSLLALNTLVQTSFLHVRYFILLVCYYQGHPVRPRGAQRT